MILNLVDGEGEYVVVDMTAGADSFASGLFTRFDRSVVVCEPTVRSVGVYRQYLGHAREFGVAVSVVGNPGPIGELEPANRAVLDAVTSTADSTERDWTEYTALAAEFHRRNASASANTKAGAKAGADLTEQIDPDFVLSPAALTASVH